MWKVHPPQCKTRGVAAVKFYMQVCTFWRFGGVLCLILGGEKITVLCIFIGGRPLAFPGIDATAKYILL